MTILLSYAVFAIFFLVFGFKAAQHLKEAYHHNYDIALAKAEASGRDLDISPEYPASYSTMVILAITFGGLLLMILGDLVPFLGLILSVTAIVFGFLFIITSKITKHQIKAVLDAVYPACFTFVFSLTSVVFKHDRTGGLRTVVVFFASIVLSFLVVKIFGFVTIKTRQKKHSTKKKNNKKPQPKHTASPQSSKKVQTPQVLESSSLSTVSSGGIVKYIPGIITAIFVVGLCLTWIIVLV